MSRETAWLLLGLLAVWWLSESRDQAQGRPTTARGWGDSWAPCPAGYTQIPPFGACVPPGDPNIY